MAICCSLPSGVIETFKSRDYTNIRQEGPLHLFIYRTLLFMDGVYADGIDSLLSQEHNEFEE